MHIWADSRHRDYQVLKESQKSSVDEEITAMEERLKSVEWKLDHTHRFDGGHRDQQFDN